MLFKEEDGKYVSNVGNKSEEIPNARRLARKCGVPLSLEIYYFLICDGMDRERRVCVLPRTTLTMTVGGKAGRVIKIIKGRWV